MIFGKVLQHFLACRNEFCDRLLPEIVAKSLPEWRSSPAFSSMPYWILRSTFARDCRTKIIENPSKIASGGSPEPPEWLRETSGTALGTLPSSACVFVPQKCRPWRSFLRLLDPKWCQAGAPKSPQNRLCAKKGLPRGVFLSIFAVRAVFPDSSFDFGSILTEKSMFFPTRFPHAARAFFEMATLTIALFLRYESHFFIFRLRAIFRKKSVKKRFKTAVRKKTRKTNPPGSCFGTPNQ